VELGGPVPGSDPDVAPASELISRYPPAVERTEPIPMS
jgi:hypothetical protein